MDVRRTDVWGPCSATPPETRRSSSTSTQTHRTAHSSPLLLLLLLLPLLVLLPLLPHIYCVPVIDLDRSGSMAASKS
eukprot:757828-Hanusia_phi.AAC.4